MYECPLLVGVKMKSSEGDDPLSVPSYEIETLMNNYTFMSGSGDSDISPLLQKLFDFQKSCSENNSDFVSFVVIQFYDRHFVSIF